MATINNIYVLVEKESMGRPVTVPQHAVETGLPLTDLVKKGAKSLSINGEIVDTSKLKADDIIKKLENLEYTGSLIKYIGIENVGNFMIADFNIDRDKNIHGGAAFDMQLIEARIAKSAYDPSKQKAAETEKKTTNPTLEVGAIVVFKGGSVYVSSDAANPAATRGRSTCKITIINERSWSKHDYHLISTDGGMVYGWVDKANIEGTGSSGGTVSTNTAPRTNAGTQQVTTTTTTTPTQTPYGPSPLQGPTKPTLVQVGSLTKEFVVGSIAYFNNGRSKVDGTWYYKEHRGGSLYYYYPESKAKNKMQGKNIVKVFPKGTTFYKKR